LRRDWYAIVDVTEVQASVADFEMGVSHPPVSASRATQSATA